MLLSIAQQAGAGDAVLAGELFIERPTLHCLGFRWYMSGDDNRSAATSVVYREKGERHWKTAQPLVRIKEEIVATGDLQWTTPNLFAGSVFDLRPGTAYEVKLSLSDPDGGASEKNVTVKTRTIPTASKGGKTLHVVPPGFTGKKPAAFYDGLAAAYEAAQPGDILLLHAGTYVAASVSERRPLADARGYALSRKATVDKPIVLRAAGDGEAIIDGGGVKTLFDCTQADYHFFEGLTLQNADRLIFAGNRKQGCSGLVVSRCRLRDSHYPIVTMSDASRDFYIADNIFAGPLTIDFTDYSQKGKIGDEPNAIWWAGSGHVICYNRFTHWWDAIHGNSGPPPAERALQAAAVDTYNNDIAYCNGDGIELDYGVHNLRCFRNRIVNCLSGISVEPIYGGPAYIFRNVLYNMSTMGYHFAQNPAGVLLYHNTVLMGGQRFIDGRINNTHLRNNLILGRDEGREGLIWTGSPLSDTSTWDYNGFRQMKNNRFWWLFSKPRRNSGGSMSTEDIFPTLKEFSEATGYEKHGVLVDYDIFVDAPMPSGKDTPPPAMDLRLKKNAIAGDAGVVLPNINDGYTGKAPDLGAYELGQPIPHYGPRSREGK